MNSLFLKKDSQNIVGKMEEHYKTKDINFENSKSFKQENFINKIADYSFKMKIFDI